MAIYEFRTKGGKVLEREYSMGTAPAIGTWVKIGRYNAQRIFSTGRAPEIRVDDVVHSSYQLPSEFRVHAEHVTPDGRPAFRTRKGIREFEAKTGWRYNR